MPRRVEVERERERDRTILPPEVHTTPAKHSSPKVSTPTITSTNTTPHKTPSKKWSFSVPLGKKLLSSPSQSSMKDPKSPGLVLSPRALSFSHKSFKDQPMSP